MAQSASRRRIVDVLAFAFSLAVAGSISFQLHTHQVPFGLVLPCGLAVFSSALSLLVKVADAAGGTLHRCTAHGCTFHVRVQNVDAAENRRWQEVAAAHPAHRIS
ncbi:hypothetical protein [Streptomyces longispororuber]|uniref:hypothetical protein n=1 Tax=Streptomyces longispororuber TaxID=68230 RepID=UPI00210BBBF8|nr:hypothetical protein [Streptomyces longispororuber]MCQ4212377.1 hypothetical protein [Streptomyces longispororuber]